MNRIKRILSMVLVCMMALSLVPVTTLTASAAATGTTALFNGNATYLLQEMFAQPATLTGDGTRVLSGWDVDYRGGDVTLISGTSGALITDSNTYERVSMSHQLMKHEGALTLETVFTFKTPVDEGFYVELTGGNNVAMRVETVRQSAGNKSCLFAVNGTNTSLVPEINTEYHLKAELTGSTVTVWINGEKIANNVAYMASTSYIDNVELGTGEAGVGKIELKNVYAYVNYTVNENFLGKDVSDWWTTANGEVVTVPGAPYKADTYGFALNPTEAVEQKFEADAPRVLVKASKAADYTWTGGEGKVTVTDGEEIGGRKNVVAAAGVGNENNQTIGVVIDGNSFAFEEDDIITYSYDIYLGTATYARTWIRDMGDFSPYITIESSDHYVNANKWTNITKSLTYAELVAAMADGWTTPGKFVVCIRPGQAQTVYLDNFIVTVTKATDNYVANVATGARVEWTNPMDSWNNNVMYGTNVSNMDYVADPAGTRSSNVLKAVVSTVDAYGVVAVKVVDNFGKPVRSLAAGETIDVSFDFRSSVAQGSTTNGTSLRIADTGFVNGSGAPTGTAYEMGSVQVSANTWTTVKGSYTATEDITIASSQTWFIPVRVPTAGTIYIDNFKLSIRNPEAAVMAPAWEINSASDVTYKNGGTATDVNDIGGRDNVVALGNLAYSNTNTAGVWIGTRSFNENETLKVSFDAYSTSAIEPDLWLRNHGSSTSPYAQLDITALTAGTWTHIEKEWTYAQLNQIASNNGSGSFATSEKYALYFRPNTSGTIYIDNFKAEIFDETKHVLDLVNGARYEASVTAADSFTWKGGTGVTVTENQSIGGQSGVYKVTGLSNSNSNTLGIKLGDSFRLYEGESLTYTMEVYSESQFSPDVWFRNHSDTTYGAYKTFYNSNLAGGTWHTVTKTITYEELNNTSDNKDKEGWKDFGNSAQYAIYLRPRTSGDIYIKSFSVAVVRPEYAFGEPPSNASLEKKFSALSGAQSLSFDVFVPSTGANGFKASFGGATFKIENGMFWLGDSALYEATSNVWYNIKMSVNGATATLYVNGAEKGTGSATGVMTSVAFENNAGKQIMIDNVKVAPTFDYDYADYPTLSDSDIANSDLDLGMVSYPMWREGNHYGWDLITPYMEDREPYLGWYSAGSPEVADWNIKWWAEHGFDHVIYPYVRPAINEAGGQPSFSVRGEELHDGYMNAKYNDKVDFAIMLTNPLAEQFTDAEGNVTNAEEWIANVLPYLTETYFKKDNYKVINNQLVVYNYDLDGFAKCMTVVDESTGSTTQNGTTEVVEILTALNNKAKSLGYAGIMFVMDQTSMTTDELEDMQEAINNASAVNTLYLWKYTWRSDVVSNITQGITNEYNNNNNNVASIPMGFESTPWVQSDVGFIEPSGIEEICNTVKSERDANDPTIVLFTCWDEWGEGHFHSPSAHAGFGYLNAARKVLTDKANALDSAVPTEDAKKRMGVLYPEGRQMLKIRQDKQEPLDTSLFTNELGTLTPTSSNYEDRSGCSIGGTWLIRDYTTYSITDSTQASVWFTAPNIDYSKVTAIKFVGYAHNSASLVVKFGNEDNGDDMFGDISHDNRFRFSAANPNPDPSNTSSIECILTPDYPNKIAEAADYGVTHIRFNTQQTTTDGGDFHIEKIVFYTDEVPNSGGNVTVDGTKMTMVSEAIPSASGITMLPAYRLLLDIGAKATYDKSTKTLTAVKDGITTTYTDGVDGAVYQAGNIFVPYDKLLAPFGYTVTEDSGVIAYESEAYKVKIDDTDYRWDFEKDGDREGWSTVKGSDRFFTEGTGVAATVRDGVMRVRSAGTDSSIYMDFDTPAAKENFTYFSMKFDTDAPQMYLRVYDDGTYSSGAGVTWLIKTADYPDGEIIINLSETADRDGNMKFAELSDNITGIRIDPILSRTGSNEIDYIQFTKGYPSNYKLVAYSFGDNLFNPTQANWTYMNGLYKEDESAEDNWGYNGGCPIIVDDGEDAGAIQLKFKDGNNSILTGFNWFKSGSSLIETLKDKQVKVSFWYKTDDGVTSMKFENRHTDVGVDGETLNLTPSSNWIYVEALLDMTAVKDDAGARVYEFRVTRNGTTGDCSAYIKDMKVCILDESTEVKMFTDNGVAIKAIGYGDGEDLTSHIVHAGAFDTTNRELNNINSNKTIADDIYTIISPTDATDEIRAYWWNSFEPIVEPLVLQKAN